MGSRFPAAYKINDFLFGYHPAVDAHSFPEIDKVGGCVKPGAVAVGLQDGRQHVGDTSLAIGSGHMDCAIAAVGMTEEAVERLDAFKTGLICGRPHTREHGEAGE